MRDDELVLTSGTTFAINLVAYSWALPRLEPGDAILLTRMEHHANVVPWQLVAERNGATIKVADITPEGVLDLDALFAAMTPEVKLLGVTHVSNVLGTINPVHEICREARRRGIVTVVDGSQALPHMAVDIPSIGCDFYAFTGHKMLGPTGIGVLWGRREVLDQLPPFLGGGEMIETVKMERSTYAGIPHKFEAGTPPIVEAVGLGAAVDYLTHIGMENIHRHEQAITAYALEGLATVPGLSVLGPLDATLRGGAISFEIDGVHPHDVAQVLDSRGIAVRAGHHCAKPAHKRFGVQSSTRMSSYLYTTPAEIDALVAGLEYTRSYFKLGGAS